MTGYIAAAYFAAGWLLSPASARAAGDTGFGPAYAFYITAWPVFALGWLLVLPFRAYGAAGAWRARRKAATP